MGGLIASAEGQTDLDEFMQIGHNVKDLNEGRPRATQTRQGVVEIMPVPADPLESHPVSRIVLVEDNTADVYLLEKALESRGIRYELYRYNDGEQAIRGLGAATAALPDLILVDLNLPRRSGFDVVRMVRQTPRFIDVPVGILTTSNTERDRHRIALMGLECYIHKPLNLDDFLRDVGSAVEKLLDARRDGFGHGEGGAGV